MEEIGTKQYNEEAQKQRLSKHMEKRFPGLHAQNLPSLQETDRDMLPKLLK